MVVGRMGLYLRRPGGDGGFLLFIRHLIFPDSQFRNYFSGDFLICFLFFSTHSLLGKHSSNMLYQNFRRLKFLVTVSNFMKLDKKFACLLFPDFRFFAKDDTRD